LKVHCTTNPIGQLYCKVDKEKNEERSQLKTKDTITFIHYSRCDPNNEPLPKISELVWALSQNEIHCAVLTLCNSCIPYTI
jgi:hypothetical protein